MKTRVEERRHKGIGCTTTAQYVGTIKGRRSAEGNRLTVDSPTRMNDAWRGTLEWSRRSGVSHVWLPRGLVGFMSMKGFTMPLSEWRKEMKTEDPSLGSTPARKGASGQGSEFIYPIQ